MVSKEWMPLKTVPHTRGHARDPLTRACATSWGEDFSPGADAG